MKPDQAIPTEVVRTYGTPEVAQIHVLHLPGDPPRLVEFVDSLDPRFPRREKWCGIVSTQAGCPVGCRFCDAGTAFRGNLSASELWAQIERLFLAHACDASHDAPKIKLHFARMGEPALNPAVLEVLEELPNRYPFPGLIPAVATTAPKAGADWLSRLKGIKDRHYGKGRFQLQLSLNSTDEGVRDWLMPIPKLGMADLADLERQWFVSGDRKISLNLALAHDIPVDAEKLARHFHPERSLVKLTPVNPTEAARRHGLRSVLSPEQPEAAQALCERLETLGFQVIVSIGDPREIALGSNCGQAANRMSAHQA